MLVSPVGGTGVLAAAGELPQPTATQADPTPVESSAPTASPVGTGMVETPPLDGPGEDELRASSAPGEQPTEKTDFLQGLQNALFSLPSTALLIGTDPVMPALANMAVDPVVTVSDLGSFDTLEEAFAAIAAGPDVSYTLTLQKSVSLPHSGTTGKYYTLDLPAKSLVIDGNGNTLSGLGTYQAARNEVYAHGDLTLKNIRLNMDATYVYSKASARVVLTSSVSGSLGALSDSASGGSTFEVNASVSLGNVNGNGSSTQLTLIGYGSQQSPALGYSDSGYPMPAQGSSDKLGSTTLKNSFLYIGGDLTRMGAIYLADTNSGLATNEEVQSPKIEALYTADGGNTLQLATNTRWNMIYPLTISKEFTGHLVVSVTGSEMKPGTTLIKAADSAAGSFSLANTDGLCLSRNESGGYVIAEAKISVDGGMYDHVSFASLNEALDAIAADRGKGAYTVTLQQDEALASTLTLPNKSLVIEGGGHTLRADGVDAINVVNELTLRHTVLELPETELRYTATTNGERTLTIDSSVSGCLKAIRDTSQSRWLDVAIDSQTLSIGACIGTTSTIDTRLTDLLLTNYGTKEQPVKTAFIQNMAAVECANAWLEVSGDATNLGVVRTPSRAANAGLIVAGDATIQSLSLWKDSDFSIDVKQGKTLTVTGKINGTALLSVNGTPIDGQVLVVAPNGKEDSFQLQGVAGGTLVYDAADGSYRLKLVPSSMPTVEPTPTILPTTTAPPPTATTTDTTTPKTGDMDTSLPFWAALMALAVAGGAGILAYSRIIKGKD